LKELSDSERGRLLTACIDYVEQGIEPELRGNERFIFNGIKASVDREREMMQLIASNVAENDAIDVENDVEIDADDVENLEFASNLHQMMQQTTSNDANFDVNDAIDADFDANSAPLPSSPPTPPLLSIPLISPKEKETNVSKKKVPHTDAEFDQFWAAYPRKVCKKAARKSFEKVDVPLETILTALEQHKKSAQWNKDKGQFIPHPATWLNNARWEDELEIDTGKKKEPRKWHTVFLDGEETVIFDD
jgi:hypothetical protein